jgi:hypothetical protein
MMALRLSAFAVALGLIFAAAALAGNAIGPEPEEEDEMTMGSHETDAGGEPRATAAAVPGLAVSDHGLRLELERRRYEPGADRRARFSVLDDADAPVTDFDVEHEREMHLIVVRRDFEEFQHLHPKQGSDGVWSAEADLGRPGTYRVFADFATDDESMTLGADLFVGGEFDPQRLPAPEPAAEAGDGYQVSLDGAGDDVRFTVRKDGERIGDVEPYLGADGHLVALREGDLAFLHTHPAGEPGGPIEFGVEYPSPGRYRLYLQFKHDGEVRTVAFTQEVSDVAGH